MKSSTRDSAEGNLHKVKGKIKEIIGNTDIKLGRCVPLFFIFV